MAMPNQHPFSEMTGANLWNTLGLQDFNRSWCACFNPTYQPTTQSVDAASSSSKSAPRAPQKEAPRRTEERRRNEARRSEDSPSESSIESASFRKSPCTTQQTASGQELSGLDFSGAPTDYEEDDSSDRIPECFRYLEFELDVMRDSRGDKLGMDVLHGHVPGLLRILSISEGDAVDKANKKSLAQDPSGPTLRVGDFILQVNQKTESVTDMVSELHKRASLRIAAVRILPAEPSSDSLQDQRGYSVDSVRSDESTLDSMSYNTYLAKKAAELNESGKWLGDVHSNRETPTNGTLDASSEQQFARTIPRYSRNDVIANDSKEIQTNGVLIDASLGQEIAKLVSEASTKSSKTNSTKETQTQGMLFDSSIVNRILQPAPTNSGMQEAPFAVGDQVKVLVNMNSNCQEAYNIPVGALGRVIKFDEDGDALIDFPCIPKNTWIASEQMHKLTTQDDTQGEDEEQCPELEADCDATALMRSLNGERGVRQFDTPLGVVDASVLFKTCICCLSLLSVLDFVLTSLTAYPGNLQETITILRVADVLATVCLCADFAFRAWASASSIQNCIGYVFSSWGLLDFTSAVVPAMSSWFHFGPWLRSLTVLRILKLERYVGAFKLFWDVLMQSQSAFVVTGVFALICWMLCSTLMYYAERHNPDDDMRKYYSSVPAAMWVTLLNLSGESPVCDYTVPGKMITAMMGIFGVGFVTIPMGLLGGGFQDELEEEAEEEKEDGTSLSELAPRKLSQKELALESDDLTPRQKVYKFLEGSACNQVADLDPWEARAVWFEQLIFTSIFLSAAMATLETVPGLIDEAGMEAILLKIFELSVTVLFSVEYCMRYYSAPESPQWEDQGYTTDGACRFAFVLSWPAMVDLVSIAPFYISMLGSDVADKYDGQLRMLRVFRLLTLDKYIPSVSLIGGVIRTSWKQFQLAAYAMLSLWLIFATLLWLTERHDATLVDYLRQDQRYASVVSALPYILVHLTGDYPLIDYTLPAKICLFFSLLFAVGVVAVPAGLMASGFSKELAKFRALQRQKALAAHSKIQTLIIGWIRRRRLRNVVRGAIAKAKQDKKRKEDAMMGFWASRQLKVNMFLEQKTRAGYRWGRFMLVMIITNVLAVSLETDSHIHAMIGHRIWKGFEVFSVLVFTGQYLAQVFAASVNKSFGNKRWNYIASFWGAVDLITIAPWWIQQLCRTVGLAPQWLTHAFIFRIVRVLRILRLDDFKQSFSLLGDAWVSCKDSMVACGFMALMVWVCGSVLFYNFEKDNPRMEGAFESLPSSMYYSLIFLGGEWGKIDFTPCGQVVCVFYCVMGIALYGIPVGVVFEAFSDVLQQAEDNKSKVAGNTDEETGPSR